MRMWESSVKEGEKKNPTALYLTPLNPSPFPFSPMCATALFYFSRHLNLNGIGSFALYRRNGVRFCLQVGGCAS